MSALRALFLERNSECDYVEMIFREPIRNRSSRS